MIIRFQSNEISTSVPAPPGKAMAAWAWSISRDKRSARVSVFHSSFTQGLARVFRQRSISAQVTPMTCPPAYAAPFEAASIVPI